MGYFLKNFLEIMALNFLGQPAPGSYWILPSIVSIYRDVYPSAGLINMASSMNAIEEMYHLSRAMSLIALVAIVPVIGYYRIYENIISILLFWNLHHYYIYIYI